MGSKRVWTWSGVRSTILEWSWWMSRVVGQCHFCTAICPRLYSAIGVGLLLTNAWHFDCSYLCRMPTLKGSVVGLPGSWLGWLLVVVVLLLLLHGLSDYPKRQRVIIIRYPPAVLVWNTGGENSLDEGCMLVGVGCSRYIGPVRLCLQGDLNGLIAWPETVPSPSCQWCLALSPVLSGRLCLDIHHPTFALQRYLQSDE